MRKGAVTAPWTSGRVHCGVEPGAQYAWAAPRNYPNVLSLYDGANRVAEYDYAVSLAPGHTQITKPIIVVSGYDPFEDTGLDKLYNRLVQYRDGVTVGPFVNLAQALKNQGYDIVVMDYADSQDFIQRNALALVDLIGRVHVEMDANPNSDGEIGGVIGLSMGGLVARYALAYMEEMVVDHRVHLFVSYDSPQQGAYVPAGLTMAFADLYGIADGVLDILSFLEDVENGVDFIERRLYGAATQQLLTFWAGLDTDATSPSAVQTDIREDLYDDFQALEDYPNDLRRVAVSNGNGDGLDQHLNPIWNATSPTRMQPGAQTLHAEAGASILWGLFGGSIHLKTRNAQVSGVAAQVYRRGHEICFLFFCDTDTDAQSTLTLTNPYDAVPGSYQPTWSLLSPYEGEWDSHDSIYGVLAWIFLSASASAELDIDAARHAFVPTVSALDYRTTSYPSREAMVNATFLNQNLSAPISAESRTPFDAFYTAGDEGDASDPSIGSESQGHLFVSNGIEAFVLEQLALPVPDRTPPVLTASISGPTYRNPGQDGIWTANASNGSGSYDYMWEYRINFSFCDDSGGGGEIGTLEVNCGQWTHHIYYDGSPSFSRTVNSNAEMDIRVTVTSGSESIEAYHSVIIGNGPGSGIEPLTGSREGEATASAKSGSASLPERYALYAAAPNPVSSTTTIRYDLPEGSEVSLVVYDLLGREAVRLPSGSREAGGHSAVLNAAHLPSGVYLVRLQAGSFVATERFTVVK